MKFETISEYEILNHAYYHIMDKWLKRIERNDEYKKEYGRENKIERHWIDKYNDQMNELHEAILKLEQPEEQERNGGINHVTRPQINPRMRPRDVPRENQPRIRRPRRAREVYQINLRKPVHQRERVSKFSP